MRAPQLVDVPVFCARHDRHWLVLDHLGKPAIGGEGDAQWREHLRRLAALPHVACKLSGLVTEVGDRAVNASELHRYLDVALELFGAQRLMFGSDWPAIGVERWLEEFQQVNMKPEIRKKIMLDNAVKFFGLTL